MKKAIICALMLAMLGTSAYAQGINTNIDLHTNDITLSGTGMTSSNGVLSVEVLDSNKNKIYVGAFKSTSDGTYSFKFRMPSSAQTGNYNVTIGSYDGVTATEEMFFATGEAVNTTMTAINGATDTTSMKTALESNYEVLNISKTTYESLDDTAKTAIATALVNGKSEGNYTDLSDANTIVRKEVAVQVFRCAKTETDIKNALNTYANVYNISETTSTCYSIAQKLSDEKMSDAYGIMSNGTCSDVSGVIKLYDQGVLLTHLNNAKDPATIKTALDNTSYQSVLGFSMTKYNASDKDKTVTYLYNLENDFTSASDVEQAIADAYTAQGGSSGGGSGSSGGGGGSSSGLGNSNASSGGSITNLPNATATTPANPENSSNNEASGFGDLVGVEWAREAIESLADKGVVSGMEENGSMVFKPNDLVTREQFVTMLVSAFDLDGGSSEFNDVTKTHWAYKFVSAAYTNGVVSGISDTEFGAGRSISREDMAVMLYRAAQKAGKTFDSGDIAFADIGDIADYAVEGVAAMNKSGIINGYSDGTFAPKGNATRAEAAQMIYMTIK